MKKFLALALAAALLTGCGALSVLPEKAPSAPAAPPPEPTAGPGLLRVALASEDEALDLLFEAYGGQQNVQVEYTSPEDCDLAVLDREPGEGWASVSEAPIDTALCGMLEADPEDRGLPLGYCGWGYLVNTRLLTALLGEGALPALQRATPEEWDRFCQLTDSWIASPYKRNVTLDGRSFSLPAARDEETESLSAVFVLADGESGVCGGPVLSPLLAAVLPQGQGPEALTPEQLEGPARGLYRQLGRERESLYRTEEKQPLSRRQAESAFVTGRALFYRSDTLRGSVLGSQGLSVGLVPFKPELDEEDITAEGLDAEALYTRPVAGPYRYLALREGADGEAARAFLYWLYVSHPGQRLLTDSLGLVQPGLRSPSGEPGRTLAQAMEEGQVLPELSGSLDGESLSAADALYRGNAGPGTGNKTAFARGLSALLCPAA